MVAPDLEWLASGPGTVSTQAARDKRRRSVGAVMQWLGCAPPITGGGGCGGGAVQVSGPEGATSSPRCLS